MALFEQITTTLTTDLAEYLADHFGLDSHAVGDRINDYLGHNSTPAISTKKISAPTRKSLPIKPASSGSKTCQFKITRGNKEGQLCGTAIRGAGDFCSKHKNRKTVQAKIGKESATPSANVTRNPKAKCWVISGTIFAVKSPRNKTVIGKVIGSKIVNLSAADKKKVKSLSVPIATTEADEDEVDDSEVEDFEDDE